MKRSTLIILSLLTAISSCMKDDDLWYRRSPEIGGSSRGLFVVNEGNFTFENASLTYYDIGSGEAAQDVFFNTNALPLGDVAISMTMRDSLGYVVINNSGRIYIINAGNFVYKGKITGFTSPRHIHFISDTKAYVTDLYASSVAVVNPIAGEITGSIDIRNPASDLGQHTTEQMLQYEHYVFTNCWSYDNKILVIDTETDQVVDSIEVIKQPNSMVLDKYNALWVISDGGWEGSPYGYETPGLVKIDAGSRQVQQVYRFRKGESPTSLKINGSGDTLYYLNRHVYRMPVDVDPVPDLLIESPYEAGSWGGFYSIAVDPLSSEIYVADAIDFTRRGMVYRFQPDGTPIDTFLAGIAPGAFCFNQSD